MRATRHGWRLPLAALTLAALASGPVWLSSCTPGEGITAAEADVVLTLFDADADFSSFRTYAVVDSIVHLCDGDDCPNIPRTFDSQIISTVKANMNARNYVEETDPQNSKPDLTIVIGAVQSDFYDIVGAGCGGGWYYPPGWGGYPGGCWGYPPSMIPVYSYSTGTLILLMANTRDVDALTDPNQQVPVVWNGDVSGVLGSSAGSSRLFDGIDQAFVQSPYILRSGS